MFELLMSYLGVAIVSYLVGRIVGRASAIITITSNLIENRHDIERVLKKYEKDIKDIEDKPESESEAIKVEKHGEQLFIYTKETDEFISQGTSLEEALDRASKRFPDRCFAGRLSQEQAKEMGINVSKP